MTETREQIIKIIEPYYAEGQTEPDITAVLKYITKNTNYYDHINFTQNILHISINSKGEYKSFSLELNPLHLYTEEEDKNLLELLQKIGKK